MTTDVDLVIVGAGAAGLSAAKEARQLGLSFTLIEASHRIGGRAYTEEFAPGVPFDLGCHWMHSASLNPFVAIADQEGFQYETDNEWHSDIFDRDRWLPKDRMADLEAAQNTMSASIAAAAAAGRDVAVADCMDLDSPWAPYLAYWFSLSTSRDIDQVSILDDVAYNDTDENWPLKQGYGSLVARWAADVPVTLNAPVHRVTWGTKGVKVESAKGTVTGRRALICVSTNILASGAIAFDPGLPNWKLDAVAALPLGVHNRIAIMLDDDPFGPDVSRHAMILLDGDDVPMAVQGETLRVPLCRQCNGRPVRFVAGTCRPTSLGRLSLRAPGQDVRQWCREVALGARDRDGLGGRSLDAGVLLRVDAWERSQTGGTGAANR